MKHENFAGVDSVDWRFFVFAETKFDDFLSKQHNINKEGNVIFSTLITATSLPGPLFFPFPCLALSLASGDGKKRGPGTRLKLQNTLHICEGNTFLPNRANTTAKSNKKPTPSPCQEEQNTARCVESWFPALRELDFQPCVSPR